MKHNSILLILSFCFLIPEFSLAQREQIIFSNNVRKSIRLNQTNNPQAAEILRIFSQNQSGRYTSNTLQTFNFQENTRIFRAGRNLHFVGYINQLSFNTIPQYRGYSISDLILPQSISCDMDWMDAAGRRTIRSFHYNAPINKKQTQLFNFNQPNPNPRTNYTLRIRNYKLNYNRNSISTLKSRISLIDEYYEAGAKLDRLISETNSINTYTRSDNYTSIQKLNRIKNDFQLIKNKNFQNTLIRPYGDPIFLQRKINTLSSAIRQKESELGQNQRNTPQNLVDLGIRAYNSGNYSSAENYFNQALQSNPQYMPAKLELARVYYRTRRINQSITFALEVNQSYSANSYTKSGAQKLLQDIYYDELNAAKTAFSRQNYDKASKHITKAERICQNTPAVTCSYELQNMKSQLNNSAISNRISQIENYIYSGNLTAAVENTRLLEKNYRYNTGYSDRQKITNLWRKIYDKYLIMANSALYAGDYSKAYTYADEASKICSSHVDIYCDSEIENIKQKTQSGVYQEKLNICKNYIATSNLLKASAALTDAQAYRIAHNIPMAPEESNYQALLKQKQYSLSAQEADNFYRNGQYDLALKKYAEVIEIQKRYNLPSDPDIQYQINKVAGAKAQEIIDRGNNEISKNNLRAAKNYAKQAQSILDRYNIAQSEPVYQNLLALKNASYSTQCQGYQNTYDKKIQYAQELMQKGKYTSANSTLKQAIIYAKSKKGCEIDYADAETFIEQIKPAVYFNNEIKEIYTLIDNEIFEDAIKKYLDLIDYYNENRLDAMNVSMKPLAEFALTGTSKFILFTANYLLDREEYDSSYKLLSELRKRKVKKSYTKELQNRLAVYYARRDHEADPLQKPAKKVLDYTLNDSWWSYFKKTYISAW